ncbi:MAG: GGDEF domain-containing protein [Candidatus Omnitrophica bacterium]|nr:GGDEF domain-containing protein [Candidatus Omnitrophota bacterium]
MIIAGTLILLIVTVLIHIILKRVFEDNSLKIEEKYRDLEKESAVLILENEKIGQENSLLETRLEETRALYEITKEICVSLDKETMFKNFCAHMHKYVRLRDCKLLEPEVDLLPYKDCTVLSLQMNRNSIGYLVADGLLEEDREKFHILSQQFLLGIKRAILYQKLHELAITDTLTGVFTRKHYLERLKEELDYSAKFGYPFGLLMLDIDHFKEYNDRYGHLVGDAVLREISRIIKENLRQIDLVGRYGGEEFSIILTQTDKEGAKLAAERIRSSIETQVIKAYDENLKVTLSIGVSVFPEDGKGPEVLIEKADRALYRAKEEGRNKVCVFSRK